MKIVIGPGVLAVLCYWVMVTGSEEGPVHVQLAGNHIQEDREEDNLASLEGAVLGVYEGHNHP